MIKNSKRLLSALMATLLLITGLLPMSASAAEVTMDLSKCEVSWDYTLTDEEGNLVQTQTSDESGAVHFSDLTTGHYTLAETQVPPGYRDAHLTLEVEIQQNAVTLDYETTFSGAYAGSGTADDPLVIENRSGHVLPQTGGPGVTPFYAAGLLLIAAALLVARRRRTAGR